jgi:hypothetical protein
MNRTAVEFHTLRGGIRHGMRAALKRKTRYGDISKTSSSMGMSVLREVSWNDEPEPARNRSEQGPSTVIFGFREGNV